MEYFNASIIFWKRETLTIGLEDNPHINIVYFWIIMKIALVVYHEVS